MSTRKVAAFLVDRANYGRLLPVLERLRDDPRFELTLVLGGSFILERFGCPFEMLKGDRLTPREGVAHEYVFHEVEGDRVVSKALSIGLGVMGYAQALERTGSDWAIVIGDRFEGLAAATAAIYTGRTLVHFQGGEVSGTLDELARHAITKLAHYHVPATEQAAENIFRMGEQAGAILTVGCPSSDLARTVTTRGRLVGHRDALVMFHPDPGFFDAGEQLQELLAALKRFSWSRLRVWWPNIDAGSWSIHRELRRFREESEIVETITHLHPRRFLDALANCNIAIGNSSSFVRDAGYFGTPVVLVGDRQYGRECGDHVRRTVASELPIATAIAQQLNHGPYPPSQLYGDGDVAARFVEALATVPRLHQTRLQYSHHQGGSRENTPSADKAA